jgi:hypothetical protein
MEDQVIPKRPPKKFVLNSERCPTDLIQRPASRSCSLPLAEQNDGSSQRVGRSRGSNQLGRPPARPMKGLGPWPTSLDVAWPLRVRERLEERAAPFWCEVQPLPFAGREAIENRNVGNEGCGGLRSRGSRPDQGSPICDAGSCNSRITREQPAGNAKGLADRGSAPSIHSRRMADRSPMPRHFRTQCSGSIGRRAERSDGSPR